MSPGHRRARDKAVFPVQPQCYQPGHPSGSAAVPSSSEGCRSRGRQARSLEPFTASHAVRPRAQLAHPDCPSGCRPCRSRSSAGRSPGSSDPAGFPGRHNWKERTGQSGEGIRRRCRARGARVSPRQPLPPSAQQRLLPPCTAPPQPSASSELSHRSSRSPLHASPEQETGGRRPPATGRRCWQLRGTHKATLPAYLPISLGCCAPSNPFLKPEGLYLKTGLSLESRNLFLPAI